ncbi:MAG: DivIVA domain-containing protein [Hymenobacteraceae bacterium]|nr:DivIVA domain-containing protein [Hymenobacteraceae bacterium]
MKITPLEIRQKTFEKAFRGLDKDEVNAFLLTLSQQWEKLLDENKDLRNKLEASHRETQKLREVESSLYKTLKTAEDTGNSILEQANKSSELKIREAQLQADQLMNTARNQARVMLEDSKKQAERMVAEMQQEVKALEQDYQRMESYLDNMVRDLRNLANEALEKAEKTKAKPKTNTNSILSRAAELRVEQPELLHNLKDMETTNTNNRTIQLPEATATAVTAAPALASSNGYDPLGDPAPDVTQPQPEVPNPITPVPDIPAPEIEQPKPDYPGTVPAPEIERPIPEIQPVKPDQPEIQPPMTEPSRNALANWAHRQQKPAGSFFDEIG